MSQSSRSRKGAAPPRNPLPGVISALIVVAVLALLLLLLLNRPSPRQSALYATGTQQALDATAAASLAQPTIEPAPSPPSDATPAAEGATSGAKSYSAPPPMTIDPAGSYSATITTPRGDIVIKLRPDLAPETVNSFVFLAREGFYDGLTWHRVLPGFMAQGGDPDGTGEGGPGYTVKGEFTDKLLFDRPGLVAMARPGNDVDGNGSQFFITTAPATHLNGQYTVFGEVVEGQEIVNAIPLRDPANAAAPGEQIVKITISEG